MPRISCQQVSQKGLHNGLLSPNSGAPGETRTLNLRFHSSLTELGGSTYYYTPDPLPCQQFRSSYQIQRFYLCRVCYNLRTHIEQGRLMMKDKIDAFVCALKQEVALHEPSRPISGG